MSRFEDKLIKLSAVLLLSRCNRRLVRYNIMFTDKCQAQMEFDARFCLAKRCPFVLL